MRKILISLALCFLAVTGAQAAKEETPDGKVLMGMAGYFVGIYTGASMAASGAAVQIGTTATGAAIMGTPMGPVVLGAVAGAVVGTVSGLLIYDAGAYINKKLREPKQIDCYVCRQ